MAIEFQISDYRFQIQTVTIQLKLPLTPALSPFDGEREVFRSPPSGSHCSAAFITEKNDSLSPFDGERARVRGRGDCMDAAKIS